MARALTHPATWLSVLLIALVVGMPWTAPLFHGWFPELRYPVYPRATFVGLTLSHLLLVLISSTAATVVGVGVGIAATRAAGREYLPLVQALSVIGQTFPPVAVLALAVPALGYGATPTVFALFVYGILPILAHTIAGLQAVPAHVIEAANGMGYAPARRLFDVELPLASPQIMAGIRTSTIINIGTATVGSTVGAVGLGSPIIEGLTGNNIAYVIQGVLIVAVLAILTDSLLGTVERRLRSAPR